MTAFGTGEDEDDDSSFTLGSTGEGAELCDSWLPGCSGDKASLLSSSNEVVSVLG